MMEIDFNSMKKELGMLVINSSWFAVFSVYSDGSFMIQCGIGCNFDFDVEADNKLNYEKVKLLLLKNQN